ncbi:hypothetical protein CCR95_19360 [Thiocystis minor]|nr:hypothetical protein [Thiocystis minor]
MLKTTLVKFLYLLDVYTAEENAGCRISGVAWKFLHFGPFSIEVAQAIDELASLRKIVVDVRETQAGDKEFALIDLGEYQRVDDLTGLGVSGVVQRRMHADMRRYGKDLSALLDHVYFRTAPMLEARPGDSLDFSDCIKVSIQDLKTIEMKKLRTKAIKQTRTKLCEMIKARKVQNSVVQGEFDEVYFSGLSLLEGEPLEIGLTGHAKLKV